MGDSMRNEKVRGVIVPIVTPFDSEGKIDKKALHKLCEYLIENKVHGIFVLGTTGEAPKLALKEKIEMIKLVINYVDGRVPVYVGTGSVSTKETLYLTKIAEEHGADLAAIVAPYYFKPSQEAVFKHFKTVAERTKIDILLYNIPSCTGYTLSIPTIKKLVDESENIVGIKDSSGNINYFFEVLESVGDDISVLQGTETLILPSLMLGAHGVVAGGANIYPNLHVKLYNEFLRGNLGEAVKIYRKIFRLASVLENLGDIPASIKEALKLKGLHVGEAREPKKEFTEYEVKKLQKTINLLEEQ